MPDNFVPPSFDDLMDEGSNFCLAVGYHMPTIFAIGTRNAAVLIFDLPDDSETKQRAMFVMGWQASREPIGRLMDVFFVMEGWMSFGPMDDDGYPAVRPSEDPERVEVLIFFHYNLRSGRTEMVGKQMIRDGAGTLIDLVTRIDSRNNTRADGAESVLMEAFVAGYVHGRKGRLPPISGPRG